MGERLDSIFRAKGQRYGRPEFGAAAIVLGVVSVVDRDSELWLRVHTVLPPFAWVVAWIVAFALVGGGAALFSARYARSGSIVLAGAFGFFVLACLPDMIAKPANPPPYVDVFEQLAMFCGAFAVYAATSAKGARAARLASAARLMLGVCALSFGWAQVVYFGYTASLVPAWIPPDQRFWTVLTTAAFGIAAIAILIDRHARLAMRSMALMIEAFGVLVWVPQMVIHPSTLSNWSEFGSNYLIAAASRLVAAL